MIPLLTADEMRALEVRAIREWGIPSLVLQEHAALGALALLPPEVPLHVLAGPGNNGGDALALARLARLRGQEVTVWTLDAAPAWKGDAGLQARLWEGLGGDYRHTERPADAVGGFRGWVVDGLFGSGLNNPLAGGFAAMVKYINQSAAQIVSIDLPSGLMSEDNSYNISANIIRADLTLTLQQKKLSMMMADNQQYLGRIKVLDIRLSPEFIQRTESRCSILEEKDIRQLLKPRGDFAHKGSMGTALLIAGSYGMSGASVLATRACLRTGVGKVITHTPKRNYEIMQISVPEAVLQMDTEETIFSEPVDTEDYHAMGIGPGLGTSEATAIALIAQLRRCTCPVVVDADALNILASHRAWMQQLPKNLIYTPHPRELDRLAGITSSNCTERLFKACELADRLHGYILLKGHFSALCHPDGKVEFCSTGNSGMATAGSGDVLTGIITALLARGYKQVDAARIGMYLHGLAGDLAIKDLGKESLIASDLIDYLPKAFLRLEE